MTGDAMLDAERIKEFEKAFAENCSSWDLDDERGAALWGARWMAELCAQETRVADQRCAWLLSNLKKLLDAVGVPAKCKGCGAEIYWLRHVNNKKAPYTREGLNHFADCPAADRFKR